MIRDSHGAPDSAALVVTGGGRGIGAQIAVRAARNGTPVALIYWSRPDNAARVVGEIEAAGGQAMAIHADVGSEADVAGAFTAVDAAFGPIGGLVNNAVLAGPPRRLAELPASELDEVFRTNVFGAFLCSREAAKRLSTKNGGGGGGIVTLSSAHAVNTGAPGNWVHFAASKAALETMSRGLAQGHGKVVFMQPEAASACAGGRGRGDGWRRRCWRGRPRRSRLMARLRSVVITRGAFPVLTSDLSSW